LPYQRSGFTGFVSLEDWATFTELSIRIAHRHCQNIVVHTDDLGAKQIESLNVPVEILPTHNRFCYNTNNSGQCWAFAKIYTYLLQTEPFIHIDNDVFLDVGIRPWVMRGDAIVQHKETHDYTLKGYDEVIQQNMAPSWFKTLLPQDVYACNCGLLGFNDISACHFYAAEALKFFEQNFKWSTTERNFMWVEQCFLACALTYLDIEVRAMWAGFHNMRYASTSGYRHIWGTMKHHPQIVEQTKNELKEFKNGHHRSIHATSGAVDPWTADSRPIATYPSKNPAGPSRDFSVPVGVAFRPNERRAPSEIGGYKPGEPIPAHRSRTKAARQTVGA